ncbi:UDP-N-acetylmuramoyl-tripeptide--D-alanyl-D-alanine ligase [Roseinatronobacter sp. HJB301]|uniref:UDP-N-acetylmuramoyl-tripeptide--D-alanyl-D-alanine ligase n=2 Tax=Roseinatronobacter alkalisoli TaxID=3028235 RepID=A0ABT5TD20_9RHOB|nr:UDP-N-acetylmuramoyl-tripeptide--D-alanyl-D-alanine ligase [Roseinatronobacter sp. HJB301]MDD7973016.1 UDP-N-acetylmuramoyl-tripeptide--D-alanyl-D-alanine ligase [Roseinatronobacter sp. HJB301]
MVPSQQEALFALAADARRRIRARVVGVTGSAGKTSVTAMIAHCLQGAGSVYATRFGANMARGISWNLCCVPETVSYCVLEMAIGQMLSNSKIAQPDVAVFTNIHPAHLIYHKDVQTIARRKAQIFSSMPADGVAVINADMEQSELVQQVAASRGLQVLLYGTGPGVDIRPIEISACENSISLDVQGDRCVVPLVGHGEYAVQNAMAIAGALRALHQPVAVLMEQLNSFAPLPGRGQTLTYPGANGAAHILDHSYNANPASMRAALDELAMMPCTGRRIAILGQMAELGEEGEEHHRKLLMDLRNQAIDQVWLLGDEFMPVFDTVSQDTRFACIGLAELRQKFSAMIDPGDLIMVKGSNSTGLFRFMERYR